MQLKIFQDFCFPHNGLSMQITLGVNVCLGKLGLIVGVEQNYNSAAKQGIEMGFSKEAWPTLFCRVKQFDCIYIYSTNLMALINY
jgi:hypothetical protein